MMWRFLMGIGMLLHRLAPPRPPKPNFWRMIEAKVSGQSGSICLYFYVPSDYETQKRLWTGRKDGPIPDEEQDRPVLGRNESSRNKMRASLGSIGDVMRRRSMRGRRWGGYPVVINFHGGGFTLGSAYDDARWCGTVVTELNAVVVSVDYRLAPEHPFPTAVEDGVDAVMWIHEHAEELGIDPDKILLSGFSSGGNMAFTVPLRLYDELTGFHRDEADEEQSPESQDLHPQGYDYDRTSASNWDSASTSSTRVPQQQGPYTEILDPNVPLAPLPHRTNKRNTTFAQRSIPDELPIKIRGIVPWYPSLDYTRTRDERRATCVRADQELPALFTDLFDDSYLHPPKDVSLDSPYLSPAVAPTSLLRNALPYEIVLHTCEYDMLLDEGVTFYRRLISDEVDKNVVYNMIPGVPHGWDKAPNPLKPTPGVKDHYLKACREMKRILGERVQRDDVAVARQSIVN
jgi:acetyl esterase/lipase